MVFDCYSSAVSSSISNWNLSAAPPSTPFPTPFVLGYAGITPHYHCLERNLSLLLPSSLPVSINYDIIAQKKNSFNSTSNHQHISPVTCRLFTLLVSSLSLSVSP